MRNVLFAAAAALPFAFSPAFADEYGDRDHEGFRVGVDILDVQSDVVLAGPANPDAELGGEVAVGAHLGYDVQFGDIVLGGLVTYATGGDSQTATVSPGVRQEIESKSLATAEARVGYAFGDFMPYAFGGVVKRDVDVTRCDIAVPAPGPAPAPAFGSTCTPASVKTVNLDDTAPLWGVGVELNGPDGAVFNLSYSQAEFDATDIRFAAAPAPAIGVEQDLKTLRLSASWRF